MKLKTSKGRTGIGAVLALVLIFLLALVVAIYFESARQLHVQRDFAFQIPSPLELAALPTATRFDFPIGSEHGALTYNAQPFTENRHLGDDLNGIGGETATWVIRFSRSQTGALSLPKKAARAGEIS